MHRPSRRDFLKTSVAASALGGLGGAIPARAAAKRTATDWVQLGKSNVRVTRLAFGTGTYGGRVQRELGQEQFTRLVRHAYDAAYDSSKPPTPNRHAADARDRAQRDPA